MASIEIQTPDGALRVRLDGDHYTIGRLSSNNIALPYPHISRQHAELRLHGQTWWVVDLQSKNGLHVGGQRVHESQLAPGVAVMLSPLISVHMLHQSVGNYPQQPVAWASQAPTSQPMPWASQAPPSQPMPWDRQPPPQASWAPSAPSVPQPSRNSFPSMPLSESITPLSELGPRSVYADDEAPFYPHMRPPQAPPHRYPPQSRPQPYGHPTYAPPPMPQMERQPARPAAYPPVASPAVQDSWTHPGQAGSATPQQQAAMAYERRRRATAGPSPVLHLCQTCGQRTQPDALYCQNCHHSIATECPRCRLSLLPIQDNCPRCQTPNPASVRHSPRTARP